VLHLLTGNRPRPGGLAGPVPRSGKACSAGRGTLPRHLHRRRHGEYRQTLRPSSTIPSDRQMLPMAQLVTLPSHLLPAASPAAYAATPQVLRPPTTSRVTNDMVQDEGEMRYWADNVFAANHWDSHCSALGADVHIVGLPLVRCWRRCRDGALSQAVGGCSCCAPMVSSTAGRCTSYMLLCVVGKGQSTPSQQCIELQVPRHGAHSMRAHSLQGGRVHMDEEEAAHRTFMTERLRIPAQVPLLLRLCCSIVISCCKRVRYGNLIVASVEHQQAPFVNMLVGKTEKLRYSQAADCT
jgi:hypothetical protein